MHKVGGELEKAAAAAEKGAGSRGRGDRGRRSRGRASGRARGSADPAPIDDGLERPLEDILSDQMNDALDESDESADDNAHLSILADRIYMPTRSDTGRASGKFDWGGRLAGTFSAWPASTLAKQRYALGRRRGIREAAHGNVVHCRPCPVPRVLR